MNPDAGDGNGTRHQLADERRAELAEVALEIAIEMGRMRLLARQRRLAVQHQPLGPNRFVNSVAACSTGTARLNGSCASTPGDEHEQHRESSDNRTDANDARTDYLPI